MYPANADRILDHLNQGDLVLDIGGWACPFNRANYVMDAESFETRGFYRTVGLPDHQGGEEEHFDEGRWIRRDICGREPYPFPDKHFDFVICSHVLEDIRDPLWVCDEMIRIGKRGYVEVPSRVAETCRGWEHPRTAGLSHHRWLIDIGENHITFLPKLHAIHSHWRFSLPASHFRHLPERERVQWLFWEGGFTYDERVIHGLDNQLAELESFVRRAAPYSPTRLGIDAVSRRIAALARRVAGGFVRRLG
ncbi:MAG TPA: methyltransferase domain-containing protein [Gemmatimonadales bacterium]